MNVLPDLIELDPRAVNGQLDLFILRISSVQRPDGVSHRNPRNEVLAVRREVVMNEQTPSSAEGQTFNLILLRIIFPRVVNLSARSGFVAECKPAQLRGRRNITFTQVSRKLQTDFHVFIEINVIITA